MFIDSLDQLGPCLLVNILVDILDREVRSAQGLASKKGKRWASVVYRFAVGIWARSPAAYEACKSVFPLPHADQLSALAKTRAPGPGVSLDFLRNSFQMYLQYAQIRKATATSDNAKDEDSWMSDDEDIPHPDTTNKRVNALLNQPNGQGVLVMDEVTLIGRLFVESSTNRIIGLADNTSSYTDSRPLFEEFPSGSASLGFGRMLPSRV